MTAPADHDDDVFAGLFVAVPKLKWHKFDPEKWRRKLPEERELVLLTFPKKAIRDYNTTRSFAIGYMKFGAGDRRSPYFITPGIGGVPDAWAPLPEEVRDLVKKMGWGS